MNAFFAKAEDNESLGGELSENESAPSISLKNTVSNQSNIVNAKFFTELDEIAKKRKLDEVVTHGTENR